MSATETQALGMVPMVIEQSGRGERSYDLSLIHISEPTRQVR
jgi:hypothetical protein